jgi:uncharacterized membrane protein (UPF0127 family)
MRQMKAKSARILFEKRFRVSHCPWMNFRNCVVANLGGVALMLAGCDKPVPRVQAAPANPPPPAANAETGFSPTNAQPKLQTIKVWLGSQELTTELAVTMPQVMTGMMFRKEMAESEGMLFVFSRAHQASFYMKNTIVPLSCAYIDPEGAILEIHDMKPLDETSITASASNIQYVLEVKQGWFERNKVGTGVVVRTEFGPLHETFFSGR